MFVLCVVLRDGWMDGGKDAKTSLPLQKKKKNQHYLSDSRGEISIIK